MPIPPGLVSEMLVPWKSSAVSLLSRVLVIRLLVAAVKGGEVEALGALDRRHHQAVRAVLALDVDGDPEVDRPALQSERLAVAPLEDPRHHRVPLRSLHDRPGDQVGEGDLHPPLLQQPVQSLPLRIQRVHGNGPEGRSRGNRQALVHRLSQHPRWPPKRFLLADGSRRSTIPSRQNIVLRHPPPGPRTSYRAKVDAILFSNPPSDRSRPYSIGPVGSFGARLGRLFRGWRGLGGAENGGGAPARRPPRGRVGPRGRLARAFPGLHLSHRRSHGHLVVHGNQQLGNGPVRRRRHLGVDLVRRDLDDRVPLPDEVALGDVPLEHDALGDRLAHLGHRDLQGRRLRHSWNECMKQR